MSLPIRLLPEAIIEFDDAVDWYDQQRTGLGAEFVKEVGVVLNRIGTHPRLHAIIHDDVRKAVVQRFPFIVIYQEELIEIIVVSIFHTSRDPSIWQDRI